VSRRGVTLVETVVVVALAALFLGVLYQFWTTAARYSVKAEARLSLLQQAQVGLLSVSRELQMARRLVYPAPGPDAKSGVAVITTDGEALLFRLDAAGKRLVRYSFKTRQTKQVLASVLDVRCRVPAVPSGRDPGLVHLTVSLAGADGKPIFLVTSARLRPLDDACPVDRFPW
jgi:hypothetical protein